MDEWIALTSAYVRPIDGRTIWTVEPHNYGYALLIRYSDLEARLCGVFSTPEDAKAATATVDLT